MSEPDIDRILDEEPDEEEIAATIESVLASNDSETDLSSIERLEEDRVRSTPQRSPERQSIGSSMTAVELADIARGGESIAGPDFTRDSFDSASMVNSTAASRTITSTIISTPYDVPNSPGVASQEERPQMDMEDEESNLIRWSKLRRISNQLYSDNGTAKYGRPMCLFAANSIVIGTSRGLVLVFDYQQELRATLGSHRSIEWGEVTVLALSADQTYIAAGHSQGDIVIWDLTRKAQVLHIGTYKQVPEDGLPKGHIKGSAVAHLNFVDKRHTALVSGDTKGCVFYHDSLRTIKGRSIRTKRILGKRRQDSANKTTVLALAYRPLGSTVQAADSLGLVAIMTPHTLVIVSLFPQVRTQWKVNRPRNVDLNMGLSGCASWFPAQNGYQSRLAYCWVNSINIVEVRDLGRARDEDEVELRFVADKRYICDEPIVAVQWMNAEIYHRDQPVTIADAYFNCVKTYKGRLFLLGKYEFVVGTISNWADRLLTTMASGDYLAAIQQVTSYFVGDGDMALCGLPSDDHQRHSVVIKSLPEMLMGCLSYTVHSFQRGDSGLDTVRKVLDGCFKAVLAVNETSHYEKGSEIISRMFDIMDEHELKTTFFKELVPFVCNGDIKRIPPSVYRELILNFYEDDPEVLEKIICRLDTKTLDLDLVFGLFRRHQMPKTQAYVLNKGLGDYETPLLEFLNGIEKEQKITETTSQQLNSSSSIVELLNVYTYLKYVLTGRAYPSGELQDPGSIVENAKRTTYAILLKESVFEQLIRFDTAKFFDALNSAFEDQFLNEHGHFNRQTLVNYLLDLRSGVSLSKREIFQLDIFIGRNYSKYPQFIMLTGKTLESMLENLIFYSDAEEEVGHEQEDKEYEKSLSEERELAIRSLLSRYKPPDLDAVITMLSSRSYFGVLQQIYRTEHKYDHLLQVTLRMKDTIGPAQLFDIISECFAKSLDNSQQRYAIELKIKENFGFLAELDAQGLVKTVSEFQLSLHNQVWELKSNPDIEFNYLDALFHFCFKSPKTLSSISREIRHEYIIQLCTRRHNSSLYELITGLLAGKNDVELPCIVDALIDAGAIDSLVALLIRQDRIGEAMIYLQDKLYSLCDENDIDTELQRYTEIGIDICRAESEVSKSEELWIKLIGSLMDMSAGHSKSSLLRQVVSSVLDSDAFFGLSNIQHDTSVIRIFRAVLLKEPNKSAKGGGKPVTVDAVRPVVDDLFAAYRYQYVMLSVVQQLVDTDTYHGLSQLVCERMRGWRVSKSGECEGCGRKVIGVGIDAEKLYGEWETRSRLKISHDDAKKRVEQAKQDDNMLAVFNCGHTYHIGCLRRLGSVNIQCIVCD